MDQHLRVASLASRMAETHLLRAHGILKPCKELAGYNAARADFDVESDNLAELDLCAVDYDRVSSVLDKSALEAEEEAAQTEIGSGVDETLVRRMTGMISTNSTD